MIVQRVGELCCIEVDTDPGGIHLAPAWISAHPGESHC